MNCFPPLELAFTCSRGVGGAARLRLRPLNAGDIPGVTAACSDPVTQRWLTLPKSYSDAHARGFIESAEPFRQSGGGIRCAVADASSDALIGCVSLKETDWVERVADVGYWALPEYRGRGYITQATRTLSLWALELGMQRLTLRALPENTASNRVAQAAGFRFRRRLHGAGLSDFGRVDINLYELTAGDYGPDPAANTATHP